MKRITALSIAALFWVVGLTASTYAQDQGQEQPKPAQHEEHKAEPHSQPHPEKAKPAAQEQDKHAQDAAKHQQDADRKAQEKQAQDAQKDQQKAQQEQQKRAEQDQHKAQQEQEKRADQDQHKAQQEQQKRAEENQKNAEKQAQDAQKDRARESRDQHHADNDRGAPARAVADNRSRRIPDDRFHAHFGRGHEFRVEHVTIVENQPRFQYSGYWFALANPWPAAWSYDDDCYIDYVDDGYYLFDPEHPGIRIAVFVVG
jgi:hypothetical protein